LLLVEDEARDAQLVLRELKRGGFDVTFLRVDTPEAMSVALEEQQWDIVISDYSMPRFSALLALAVVKHKAERFHHRTVWARTLRSRRSTRAL
jgi:CheY-like chemotaxis protein